MTCPSRDEFTRQAKAATPESWFILHLLVCQECCGQYVIGRIAREWCKKNRQEEESLFLEPANPLARDWMTWWSIYLDPDSRTSH